MDVQYAAAYKDLYKNHWWWRVREEILLGHIRRILSGVPNARILDVGCGAGLFFDALEPFGRVEGIESDLATVEQSGKWKTRIVVGELDGSYNPNRPFDLILLLDVLEHVNNPEHILRRAREILKPTGVVLITVPAFNALWTSHDELNDHVRRFTAAGLRGIIQQAGLVTLQTSYMFQSLAALKLFVRAGEAMTSGTAHVPRIPAPAVNRAIQAWYRTEYAVAHWLPFGSSLLAVATSPVRVDAEETARITTLQGIPAAP